jgi:hypothetical protein
MGSKAHHIASVVVAAYLSRFHRPRGVFHLASDVDPAPHVVFDPTKAGVSGPEAIPSHHDPEVVKERAVIDMAGHVAEEIYHIVDRPAGQSRAVKKKSSLPDDAVLGIGDIDVKRSDLVQQTLDLVSRNWFAVRDLSRLLLLSEDGSLDSEAAIQRLHRLYEEHRQRSMI